MKRSHFSPGVTAKRARSRTVPRRRGPVGAGRASRLLEPRREGQSLRKWTRPPSRPESPQRALPAAPPRRRPRRRCLQEPPSRPWRAGVSTADVRALREGQSTHLSGGGMGKNPPACNFPKTSLCFTHTNCRRHWLRDYSKHTKRDGRRLLRRGLRDKWLHRNEFAPRKRQRRPAVGNGSLSTIYLCKAEAKR